MFGTVVRPCQDLAVPDYGDPVSLRDSWNEIGVDSLFVKQHLLAILGRDNRALVSSFR